MLFSVSTCLFLFYVFFSSSLFCLLLSCFFRQIFSSLCRFLRILIILFSVLMHSFMFFPTFSVSQRLIVLKRTPVGHLILTKTQRTSERGDRDIGACQIVSATPYLCHCSVVFPCFFTFLVDTSLLWPAGKNQSLEVGHEQYGSAHWGMTFYLAFVSIWRADGEHVTEFRIMIWLTECGDSFTSLPVSVTWHIVIIRYLCEGGCFI
jgi:hypothetical protein